MSSCSPLAAKLIAFFESIMLDGQEGLKIKHRDALVIGMFVSKTVNPSRADVVLTLETAVQEETAKIGRTPEATEAICAAVGGDEATAYDVEASGMPAVFGALLLGVSGSLADPSALPTNDEAVAPNPFWKSSARTVEAFAELCRAAAGGGDGAAPAKKRRAPSAAAAAKKKAKTADGISLRQSMRLTKKMPDFELRQALVSFFEKRVDPAVHLETTIAPYPATLADFERAAADSGAALNAETRSACQDVLRRCKSWVDYRRMLFKTTEENADENEHENEATPADPLTLDEDPFHDVVDAPTAAASP